MMEQLILKLKRAHATKPEEVAEVVEAFVFHAIADAISTRTDLLADLPDFKPVLQRFKTEDKISEALLKEKGLKRPSPDRVLRLYEENGEMFLVPHNCVMAFVLRHDLQRAPSMDQLKKMCVV
jgi:hypothetical protein